MSGPHGVKVCAWFQVEAPRMQGGFRGWRVEKPVSRHRGKENVWTGVGQAPKQACVYTGDRNREGKDWSAVAEQTAAG